MRNRITIDDLILMFGNDFIPAELDRKILMKHFEVGSNRIIGEKTIDKVKQVLLAAIDATKAEQFKNKGGVIDSPVSRLSSNISVKKEMVQIETEESSDTKDKYGLNTLKDGIVSQRLKEKELGKDSTLKKETLNVKNQFEDSSIPSVEDLTVLSGGKLQSKDIDEEEYSDGHVQREISIRDYKVKDEGRSIRWGKENVRDRKGHFQEINHPAYIFHSDLWQIEAARESSSLKRCDILQHVVLDMIANNINVVMLENESEPFFVVEGYGYLYSKDTLKDRIKVEELIQLIVISCDAWQIALKRPESMIKGRDDFGKERSHTIDMTSVIPLTEIRNKTIALDSEFKSHYENPNGLIHNTLQILGKHRKNIIWTCGTSLIPNLHKAIKQHKDFIDNPQHSLNAVVIGTNQAIHPIKIKYNPEGGFSISELLPGYCKKHSILSESSIKNIFGCIPAIYDTQESSGGDCEMSKIAHAVYQRVGYSALETQFSPGYRRGNPSDIVPISKLDIILPPSDTELLEKFSRYGFEID
ncbi:MAG: hypothetical protein FK733_13255 [Asgard group archaeon]|nr:hypothetical protein [Asgard group archaeon]